MKRSCPNEACLYGGGGEQQGQDKVSGGATDRRVLGVPRSLCPDCAGGAVARAASEGANPLNSLLGAYSDDD